MHQPYTRELTNPEKQASRKLTTNLCANYECEYECLLLDGTCYMHTIGFNTSTLCQHSEIALLQLESEREVIFKNLRQHRTECIKSKNPLKWFYE